MQLEKIMRKSTLLIYLSTIISFLSFLTYGQNMNSDYDSIKANSKLWDIAFNERDTITYFKFATKKIAETVGGGSRIGIEKFKVGTKALFRNRPDITLYMHQKDIEINEQWKIAYDTGEWVESWTEKNDSIKSEIKGKYWRMWKKENNEWMIMSVTFTPLSCKGSYCE